MKYVESIDWMEKSKSGLLLVIYKREIILELHNEDQDVVLTCIWPNVHTDIITW